MSIATKSREVCTYGIEVAPVETRILPECPADCPWMKMKNGRVNIATPATPLKAEDLFPPPTNGANNKRVLAAKAYIPIDDTVRAFARKNFYVPRSEVLRMLSGQRFRANCGKFPLRQGCAFDCRKLPIRSTSTSK